MKPFRAAVRIILCVLGLFAFSLSAQESTDTTESKEPAPVMIRSSVEPETGAYVGQKVRLHVDVMTNTWFPQAPQFPELRIPGAICLELSQFGINFTERIEGETYAVQRKEYVIYPQRAEQYSTPSLTVDIVYARPGQPHGEASLNSPTQTFTARIPEQAKALDYFVTTPRLQVNETYDRQFDGLKVGDSVKRTVTMTADDSVGMLLPPLEFSGTEGLAVYTTAPRMEDESNRGVYTGRRIESATYVMEKEGEYSLPEISIFWFDIQNKQVRTEILPAVSFAVAANPDLEEEMLAFLDEEEPEVEEQITATIKKTLDIKNLVYLIIAIIILLAALWIFIIPFLKRLLAQLKRRKILGAESEKAYFKHFRGACRSGNPNAIMNCLMAWLDRAYKGRGTATLERFLKETYSPELAKQIEQLMTRLYGVERGEVSQKKWSGRVFFKSVARARRKILKSEKVKAGATGLNPLNP
jgi:hypothetical protein